MRSRQSESGVETNLLMMRREQIAACSGIRPKHVSVLYGQNVDILDVKTGGTHSNHNAF